MHRISISRKELYDQVWETAMIKLAKQYCMSDQALRKICKQNDIPIPSVKYRSRKFSGYEVARTPLTGDPNRQISIMVRDGAQEVRKKLVKNKQKQDVVVLPVPDELHSFHPITRQIKQKMRDKYAYSEGAYRFRRMCLSKDNWDRGIRIFDTIIRSLEKNFGKVDMDAAGAFIRLKRSCMHIYISEKIESADVTPPLTAKQEREIAERPYLADYLKRVYEYTATNVMTIMIDGGGSYEIAARRNFKDNTKQRLEDQIEDILIAIKRLADIEEHFCIKREHEYLKSERERKLNAQKGQQLEEIQKQLEELEEQVKQWQRAEQIRAFVKAKVQYALTKPGEVKSFTELRRWANTGCAYADALDPVLKP